MLKLLFHIDNIKDIGAIHPCHIPDKKVAGSSVEYEPSPGMQADNKNKLIKIIMVNFTFFLDTLFITSLPIYKLLSLYSILIILFIHLKNNY